MKAIFTNCDRKKLAKAIASVTGAEAKYKGAPTFAYEVGDYMIGRDCGLTGPDAGALLTELHDMGFDPEELIMDEEPEEPAGEGPALEPIDITISRDSLTDGELENLQKIIASKEALIKKAIGTDDVDVHIGDEGIAFPWFYGERSPEQTKAYTDFISKLCDMARTQKRVTAKEQPVDNERYAFRCFLLRLGFIGKEYKEDRKVLLENLSGSAAFKDGKRKGEEE